MQDHYDNVRAKHKRVQSQCENVELEPNPAYVELSTHPTEPQYEDCEGVVTSSDAAMEEPEYEVCDGDATISDIVLTENPAYISQTYAEQAEELDYL